MPLACLEIYCHLSRCEYTEIKKCSTGVWLDYCEFNVRLGNWGVGEEALRKAITLGACRVQCLRQLSLLYLELALIPHDNDSKETADISDMSLDTEKLTRAYIFAYESCSLSGEDDSSKNHISKCLSWATLTAVYALQNRPDDFEGYVCTKGGQYV